jgi:hypothetical protein
LTVRCIAVLLLLVVAMPATADIGQIYEPAQAQLEKVLPEEQPAEVVRADPTINGRIDSLVDWLGAGLSMHKENYLLFPTWSIESTPATTWKSCCS